MAAKTDFTIVITRAGQRWDSLAFEVYGNSFAYAELVCNNPELSAIVVFEGGERVKAPEIEAVNVIAPDRLPPWRR